MPDITPEPEVTELGTLEGSGDGPALPPLGSIPTTVIHPEDESRLPEIPVADVKAEDVGTFSIRYRGSVPQLVVTGGTIVPSLITVVDAEGYILAEYEARPAPAPRITSRLIPEDQNELGCVSENCRATSLRRS
ncbi:hypothetical protein [Streptomyces sp. NPDC002287]